MNDSQPLLEQFIPEVYDGDVRRVVYRDFPLSQHERAFELIEGSKVNSKARIALACLKIAKGNLRKLQEKLTDAIQDYRDVICEAEYPNYTPKAIHMNRLSENEQRAIIELDKSQYLEWLNKK